MQTLPLPSPNSPERSRLLSAYAIRRRALERLYERRDAVDQLIRSLERYRSTSQEADRALCIEFNVAGK